MQPLPVTTIIVSKLSDSRFQATFELQTYNCNELIVPSTPLPVTILLFVIGTMQAPNWTAGNRGCALGEILYREPKLLDDRRNCSRRSLLLSGSTRQRVRKGHQWNRVRTIIIERMNFYNQDEPRRCRLRECTSGHLSPPRTRTHLGSDSQTLCANGSWRRSNCGYIRQYRHEWESSRAKLPSDEMIFILAASTLGTPDS